MATNVVEIWKDVKGFEGLYQVSSFGQVKSLNYRRRKGVEYILSIRYAHKQRLSTLILYRDGVMYPVSVNRLVAETFITGVNIVDEDDTPRALFFSKYENRNEETSLTIENTLLSYKFFIPSFLGNVFMKFCCCGCGRIWAGCKLCWDRIEKVFGISLVDNENPFDLALKKVVKEYQTFDDIAFDRVDEKHPEVEVSEPKFDTYIFEELETLEIEFRKRLADGEYDFCYYGYLQYLMDNCKEYFDGILD